MNQNGDTLRDPRMFYAAIGALDPAAVERGRLAFRLLDRVYFGGASIRAAAKEEGIPESNARLFMRQALTMMEGLNIVPDALRTAMQARGAGGLAGTTDTSR